MRPTPATGSDQSFISVLVAFSISIIRGFRTLLFYDPIHFPPDRDKIYEPACMMREINTLKLKIMPLRKPYRKRREISTNKIMYTTLF